jgi:hypothetical protein
MEPGAETRGIILPKICVNVKQYFQICVHCENCKVKLPAIVLQFIYIGVQKSRARVRARLSKYNNKQPI